MRQVSSLIVKLRSVIVKVKFALEEAMKAQRESRSIALLFLQSRQ